MTAVINLIKLPHACNHKLAQVLQKGYIREEFRDLTVEFAQVFQNHLVAGNEVFSADLIRLINNVLLDNVLRFLIEKDPYHFATTVANTTLTASMTVRIKYLSDLLVKWMIAPPEDQDEREMNSSDMILNWLIQQHFKYKAEMDEALVEAYTIMRRSLPYRYMRTYRFELTGELAPVVLYTDVL